MKRVETTYHIIVKDDGTKQGSHPTSYVLVVERVTYDDGSVDILTGYPPVYSVYGEDSLLTAGYRLREPVNKKERESVAAHREWSEKQRDYYTLRRKVERDGTSVTWQNLVAGMAGQGAREVFATEDEAIERARQAEAGEALPIDREPVAISRESWG